MRILSLALRNLLRQKRRNFFLGLAMSIGAAVLITANSFAHGISIVLFDRIVVYMTGHVSVGSQETGANQSQIFRDGPWIQSLLAHDPRIKQVNQAIGVLSRAMSANKSDNVVLVGIDLKAKSDPETQKHYEEDFPMLAGKFTDLSRKDVENPTVLAESKAKALDVKVGDLIRVRFRDINGQNQAIHLTVVGIFQPSNPFMSAPLFVDLENLKVAMGFQPWELPQLNLVLYHPKDDAVALADELQKKLAEENPSLMVKTANRAHQLQVLPLRADSVHRVLWPHWNLADSLILDKDLSILDSLTALQIHVKLGDTLQLNWAVRHPELGQNPGQAQVIIKAIKALPQRDLLLWREEIFFKNYLNNLPPRSQQLLPQGMPWDSLIAKTWTLMPRVHTTDELKEQVNQINQRRWKNPSMMVRTMYESASDVLKLEYVLNLITLIGVAILLLIVSIGVVNSLRMSIRERTREIGTLRALGMQRGQILALFLAESAFLALLSGLAGTILAYGLMFGLSSMTIHTANNPLGMLLIQGHLFFAPTLLGVLGTALLLLLLTIFVSILPSWGAARQSPASALRHFE